MATTEQIAALESAAGRTLLESEIALIDVYLPQRNDVAIAAILSAGRVKLVTTEIGIGMILAAFGGQGLGGQFLDTLETVGTTNRDMHWMIKGPIQNGVFDASIAVSRAGLQALAVQFPQFADGITALLALAERPDPIHYSAVSDALNGV